MGLNLNNPFVAASGCFGFGLDYQNTFSPNELGAITLKTLTLRPREGNKGTRVIEVKSGLLNSIGLENPGLEFFLQYTVKNLEHYLTTPLILNIAGDTIQEYVELAEAVTSINCIQAIEVNVSCPNVHNHGASFGADPKVLTELVKKLRKVVNKPLIIKLTPNVTDIAHLAKICEEEGADALTLINTVLGMKINVQKKAPYMLKKVAGLSGPCIFPIAVRCVYQVREAVKIPIIGTGGVNTAEDVFEMIMAGAQAIGLGSAFFKNPLVVFDLKKEIEKMLPSLGVHHLSELVGVAHDL